MRTLLAAASVMLVLGACGDATGIGAPEKANTDAVRATSGVAAAQAAEAGTVTVMVSSVQPGAGPLLIALQNEANFAKPGGAYTQVVQPADGIVTATFSDVTPGAYAAAAVQDSDKSGDISIGARGPTEPWGFSGDAQKGAPKFGPASFQVTTTGGRATITLRSR